jgi:hypothetical protein
VIIAIPALFVAASMGLSKFGLTVLVFLFVQQVETNLLVPFIMGKQMKLHAVTIIFFTFVMSSLFGFLGVILVVPAAALVKILVSEFYLRPRGIRSETVAVQVLRAHVKGAPKRSGGGTPAVCPAAISGLRRTVSFGCQCQSISG